MSVRSAMIQLRMRNKLDSEGNPYTALLFAAFWPDQPARYYLSHVPYVVIDTPHQRAYEIEEFKKRQERSFV